MTLRTIARHARTRFATALLVLLVSGATAWAQTQQPPEGTGGRRPHLHYHEVPQADVQGRVEMLLFIVALLVVLRAARLAIAERPWSTPDDPGRVTPHWRSARRQTAGLVLGLIVGAVLTPVLPHQHGASVSLESDDHAGHDHAAEAEEAHEEEGGLFHLVFFPVLGGAVGSLLSLMIGTRKRAAMDQAPNQQANSAAGE